MPGPAPYGYGLWGAGGGGLKSLFCQRPLPRLPVRGDEVAGGWVGTHPETLASGLGPSPLIVRRKGPAKGWSQVRPQGTRHSEGRMHRKTGSWPGLGLGVGRVETVGREMPNKAAPQAVGGRRFAGFSAPLVGSAHTGIQTEQPCTTEK